MLAVPDIQQDIETCLQLLQGLCEAITAVRAADIAGFAMVCRCLLGGWQVQAAREIQRCRGIRSAHRSVVSLVFKSHRYSCRDGQALVLSRLDAGNPLSYAVSCWGYNKHILSVAFMSQF